MRPLTVGVVGDLAYAKDLGKKSTESDVQLASFREGDVLVSMVLPLRYPEKPQALAYAINAADALLVVVSGLTKELGECILAADAARVPQGLIVLRNYVQPEQLAPMLKGTALQGWEVSTDDKPAAVRAKLAALPTPAREGPVQIPVDHHFDVKGIGTVILGFVRQGAPRRHESYRLYPTAKSAQVRSIQVHDEDVDVAAPGDHVGLALKGITNDEVDRGHVLAPDGSLQAKADKDTLKLQVQVSRYFKGGVAPDMVCFLALGWQFLPVRVHAGKVAPGATGTVEVALQKPVAFARGERGILFNLDAPQRVVGGAVVEG